MLVTIARRNMLRYRRKSFAALLSIVMAFITLSLFHGYLHDVRLLYKQMFVQRQMLGDMIIERKNVENPGRSGIDTDSLGPAETQWIEKYFQEQAGDIRARVRFLNINGFVAAGSANGVYLGLAYDVNEGRIVRGERFAEASQGLHLDQSSASEAILLGPGLAELLGCDRGAQDDGFSCPNPSFQLQVSTEKAQANAMDMQASGLQSSGFSDADKYFLMMSLANAHKLYDTQRVSYITLSLQDEGRREDFIDAFNASASAAGIPAEAMNWTDHSFGDLYRQSMDFLRLFRNLIVSIVLAIVITAVLNTFIKSVQERLKEIGTLRSLGYQPQHVLLIFCSEAAILAMIGSVIGIAFSYSIAAFVNALKIYYKAGFLSEGVLFRIDLQLIDFLWIGALMTALTVLSTAMVTWKATRQSVADLLVDR